MNNQVIALIPIRMGSKGIPNKNIRKIGGKSLLQIAIEKCQKSDVFSRIIVTSENPFVLDFAKKLGAEAHHRSLMAASDGATLEEVAVEVVNDLNLDSGEIAIVQATSPSFGAVELGNVVKNHIDSGSTTSILVKPVFHLHWRMSGSIVEPIFSERVNRQYMTPELFSETGAILITNIKSLKENLKIDTSKPNLVVAREDFEDIDTMWDFYQARTALEKLTVVFRLSANQTIGSGHLYHALLVADELPEFRRIFITYNCSPFAKQMIEQRGYVCLDQTSENLLKLLEELGVDAGSTLLINDTLDTDQTFWDRIQGSGLKCIAIEDLGAGPQNADVTINALYSSDQSPNHPVLTGAEWTPIRREFELAKLQKTENSKGKPRITITFGGVDPANLTQRICNILSGLQEDFDCKVILGIGYSHQIVTNLEILDSPINFEAEIAKSDIVFTSGGRTVYEAAFLGKPSIVIAQNSRETTHHHLDENSGVVYLGLHSEVSDAEIESAVLGLLHEPGRREILGNAASLAVDGRGAQRIAWIAKSLLDGAPIQELLRNQMSKSDQLNG